MPADLAFLRRSPSARELMAERREELGQGLRQHAQPTRRSGRVLPDEVTFLLPGCGRAGDGRAVPGSVHGQAALFYLVLAMALATLFRSEAAGAMAVAALLGLNGLVTGFGENQVRISPFWNPHAIENVDPAELFAWTPQNRVGIVLRGRAVVKVRQAS